jgi:F-type H+-transporting ATPase subunit epsilon
MELKILLPYRVFMQIDNVSRIVMETSAGYYGILPQRLDCVAALIPGILTYESETSGIHHVAVDEGVMVKTGTLVQISARNAIGGADIGNLRDMVDKEFRVMDEREKNIRSMMAKLESGFIQGLRKLREE